MHVLVGACTESNPITCSAQGASSKLSATRWWGCCKWSPGWHGSTRSTFRPRWTTRFPRYSMAFRVCKSMPASQRSKIVKTMNINLAAHKIKLPDSLSPKNHQCSGKHLSEKRQWWSQRLAKQLAILRPFGTHSWPQSNRFSTFLVCGASARSRRWRTQCLASRRP